MRHDSRPVTLALALTAVMLLASLPVTEAAGPQPAAWSPARVPAAVTALALAKDAGTLAVGNAPVSASPSGSVGLPEQSLSRFRVFDVDNGRVFNASENPGDAKTAVAASRDGRFVVSAGTVLNAPTVSYYRVPDERQSTGYSAQWSATQPGPVSGVALTADGKRVVVATQEAAENGPRGVLRVYDESKNVLMQVTNPGAFTSVAVSADGQYVIAGGAFRNGDDPTRYGVVYMWKFPNTQHLKREIVTTTNASLVTDVEITPDGKTFAALTEGGEVLVFQNQDAATPAPKRYGTPDENATARGLALAEDGRLVLAGRGANLVALENTAGGALTPLWNRTFDGSVTSVDVNGTGAILLAGVSGNDGGVYAFAPSSAMPFWNVASSVVTNATIRADGRWIAYASGDNVHAARLPSRVTLLFETSPGEGVPSAPFATTEPFKPIAFPMLVRNDGAYPETVRVSLPSAPHVRFTANATTFDLNPGEVGRLEVTVTPQRLNPGPYEYNVTAESAEGAVTNASLAFRITGQSAIRAEMQRSSERRVVPGDNDSVILTLTNEGNSAANVSVSVAQDPSTGVEWPVHLVGQNEFQLSAGGFSTVRVLVQVPKLAVNGSENRVAVTVTSPSGSTTSEVLYKVNPFVGVNLTVPGRTKFVYAPGESALFNVTVQNSGSVAAQFALGHETQGSASRHWVTGLDTAPFTLAPGENRTLPVRVFAPTDGEVGDRALVLVEVRSIPTEVGLPEAYDNLTLFVNLLQPPPAPAPQGGERVDVPHVGVMTLAGVLAGVAVATAGRRRFQ